MKARIYMQHPGLGDTVAVAVGFSWPAFFLGFMWALSKKMWFAAFAMLVISILLMFTGFLGEEGDIIGFFLSVLFGVACGQYGNRWHQLSLERQGYVVL